MKKGDIIIAIAFMLFALITFYIAVNADSKAKQSTFDTSLIKSADIINENKSEIK